MAIAFFDSGVGGLTVLHEAMKRLPAEHFIYYADIDNVPYGTKDNGEIQKLVTESVDFLISKNIKTLVLACNTATSVVVNELRQNYNIPIVGMEPAIKPAVELQSESRILLCATDRTLREDKLKGLIKNLDADDKVTMMSLQELVMYCENFDFHSISLYTYLEEKFAAVDWDAYGSIVLGCTHFIFYKNIIKEIIPDHVMIIDGNMGTINRLHSLLAKDDRQVTDRVAQCDYYISKRSVPSIYFDHYLRFLNELNP
jgi:glutamate racemase